MLTIHRGSYSTVAERNRDQLKRAQSLHVFRLRGAAAVAYCFLLWKLFRIFIYQSKAHHGEDCKGDICAHLTADVSLAVLSESMLMAPSSSPSRPCEGMKRLLELYHYQAQSEKSTHSKDNAKDKQ